MITATAQLVAESTPAAMTPSYDASTPPVDNNDGNRSDAGNNDDNDGNVSKTQCIKNECKDFAASNQVCLHPTLLISMSLVLIFTIGGVISSSTLSSNKYKNSNNNRLLRLGSSNLHLGMSRKFDFDPESMVEEISNFDVDMLCMQEVSASNWVMGGMDILDYFSKKLNLKYGTYGSSQVAPAGFGSALLSKIPFKKEYRYHLPNSKYQSNAIVVELDGKKYFNLDHDVAIMCLHLGTGNDTDKQNQVRSMVDIAIKYTDKNYSFAVIGDWNADMHTRCNLTCENNHYICQLLVNLTTEANLNEFFYTFADNNITLLKKHRTSTKMDKLLDYGFMNQLFTVTNATVVEYEECYNSCCKYGTQDYVREKCKICSNTDTCKECSASDHLPIIIDLQAQ